MQGARREVPSLCTREVQAAPQLETAPVPGSLDDGAELEIRLSLVQPQKHRIVLGGRDL